MPSTRSHSSHAVDVSPIEFDQESVMPLARKADVIVAIDGETPELLSCLERVLEFSGPDLRCLIVIGVSSSGPNLERLANIDRRVRLVLNSDHPGHVGSHNRGLMLREGDAVLLQADTFVTAGWLNELAAVARATERTACVAPLSVETRLGSV